MSKSFSEVLKQMRLERNLSQQQFAELLYVNRSTIASWETGRRIPDVTQIRRISGLLHVDTDILLGAAENTSDKPNVIMADDEKIILAGGLALLKETLPDAEITGFTKPSEVIEFAKNHVIALAFLDIEMGKTNGLDLCRDLLQINPRTNVVFLTAYMDYSLSAWDTGACGFLLKPLSAEKIQKQIALLRYPVRGLLK